MASMSFSRHDMFSLKLVLFVSNHIQVLSERAGAGSEDINACGEL
jgi:hypothetical protein